MMYGAKVTEQTITLPRQKCRCCGALYKVDVREKDYLKVEVVFEAYAPACCQQPICAACVMMNPEGQIVCPICWKTYEEFRNKVPVNTRGGQ